jgi:hypothetical protein
MSSCAGQAVAWHVGVDALGLAGCDLVSLVPDSYGTIGIACTLVECLPCGQMPGIALVGVGKQMIEAAPVLNKRGSAPYEAILGGEEAEGRIGVELFDHRRHSAEGRKPLLRSVEAVNTDADEKDDEGAFDAGGISTFEDGRHNGERISRRANDGWGCARIQAVICDGLKFRKSLADYDRTHGSRVVRTTICPYCDRRHGRNLRIDSDDTLCGCFEGMVAGISASSGGSSPSSGSPASR